MLSVMRFNLISGLNILLKSRVDDKVYLYCSDNDFYYLKICDDNNHFITLLKFTSLSSFYNAFFKRFRSGEYILAYDSFSSLCCLYVLYHLLYSSL